MVNPDTSPDLPFWHDLASAFWQPLTRLGEAQLLLPALLLAVVWLARRPGGGRLAGVWLAATTAAALLTTATKVAFIGYGIGYAPLDFTGISGHAMFAAAVLPPLVLLAGGAWAGSAKASGAGVGDAGAGARRTGLLVAGYGLAGAVAVSRVMVGAHSWSEVLAGAALGALCSGIALASARMPAARLARWVPAALAAWALLAVAAAPPSRTHDLVTRLALAQSGRAQPYQRWEMQRAHRLRQPGNGRARPALDAATPGLTTGTDSLQPR
jgi:membrane-associated phospholipid phosphatase